MADAREVVARFIEAINAHDEEAIRSLNSDSAVFEGPGDVHLDGREPITQYSLGWLNAFPDATITVHTEVVDGDWVAQSFTFQGTHEGTLSGPAGDIPPTGRQLTGRASQFIRVEGDEMVESHLYFDQVQLMTQLGLMPEPAAAS
jgi:predicted ester cyclase